MKCDRCDIEATLFFEVDNLITMEQKYGRSCQTHAELVANSLYSGPKIVSIAFRFFTNENPQWQSWPPPKLKEKKQTGRKPKQNPS